MNAKTITITLALLLSTACGAMAQSGFTSGAADDRAGAGYPSSYGGTGVYAYAPHYVRSHDVRHHQHSH